MSSQRKALIIANDEYEQAALRDLLAPAADADALDSVLSDPQIGNFAVDIIRNKPAHFIQMQIEEIFSESRPDDVLLVHFSGHGLKSESGNLFFAASNTRLDRLRATAVPAEFVQQCMQDSRSRTIVLLLDCCYGGAFTEGVKVRASGDANVLDSFPQRRLGGGRGRAVITASSAMEYAFEGDHLGDDQRRRPSVFTSALVEGLATGNADQDEDGWVSLDELYDYVFDKVREQNPHQTPSKRIELEGKLYLARSQRRRVRLASIPSDLQAALSDTNMFARLGAVAELRQRLASNDLPVAVRAYEALTEVARTASKDIADPAAEALSAAAVQPAQTEVHFGRLEQGAARPHQIIQLLGPPIARACVPHPSHDWIRVEQAGEAVDISINTARMGTLRGSLNLKGPTGEAAITIDVELVPSTSRAPSSPRLSGPTKPEVMPPAPSSSQPKGRSETPSTPRTPPSDPAPRGSSEPTDNNVKEHTRLPPVIPSEGSFTRLGRQRTAYAPQEISHKKNSTSTVWVWIVAVAVTTVVTILGLAGLH